MTGKTYCILGGGGSFGIHTAFYLLDHASPKKVIGIGRSPLRQSAFSLDIDKRPKYEYYVRHISYELDLLLELLDRERPQVIINYAAQGEGAVSWNHSWRFFDTNSTALVHLCEELHKRNWLERFIQIGTSEMYGSVDHSVAEDEPIKPTSPYAASKVAFDMYLMSAHKFLKFPMNILRPCNAYCPGQLLHRIIPKAFWCGITGNKLPLHGGGKARKMYIHARDLARAIYLVSESAPLGEVYNVGSTAPISILDVVMLCSNQMGIDFQELCTTSDDRLGQDSMYWLDSKKIRNHLGWFPEISMFEGLPEMHLWATKYADQLRQMSPDYNFRA